MCDANPRAVEQSSNCKHHTLSRSASGFASSAICRSSIFASAVQSTLPSDKTQETAPVSIRHDNPRTKHGAEQLGQTASVLLHVFSRGL